VHEHEAARAIGVLGHACAKAGLAEQRTLLVARHAAHADGVAQQVGGHVAEMRTRWLHLRHQRLGNAQQRQQLVVPLVGVHVEQHSARGIAHIGHMHLAMRELPHEPAVHRAEGQLAALCLRACAGHMVQQPLQLGA